MNSFFKIGLLFIAFSLSACSAFYTRHYTKGVYHEGFAKKSPVDQLPKFLDTITSSRTAILKDTVEEKKDSRVQAFGKPHEPWTALIEQNRFQKPEKKVNSFSKTILKKPFISAKRITQKTLRSGTSNNSTVGKALLYILAIILALAIVALAIYFLPAILIPAPVSSAFMTLVLIAIIVVLAIFVLLIYSLGKHLISLFKHKKPDPEDDF